MNVSRTTSKTRSTLRARKVLHDIGEEKLDESALINHSASPRLAHDSGERHALIEQLAYQYSEARGFSPGHELDDWLAAETVVDARLMGESHAYLMNP